MIQPARTAPLTNGHLAAFAEHLVRTFDEVVRREDAGPALKMCYLWLWLLAGAKPGRVVITYRELGARFGVSHEAARHWVRGTRAYKGRKPTKGLVELKWIEVIAEDRDGKVLLAIEDPANLDKPRRFVGDPQDAFAFRKKPEPEPAPESADTIALPQQSAGQTLEGFNVWPADCWSPPAHPDGSPEGRSGAGDGRASMDPIGHSRINSKPIHGAAGAQKIPRSMREVLAELSAKRPDPARRDSMLTAVVCAIDDPQTHPSIFGKAVDLVLYHGAPGKELRKIIGIVRRKRKAGKVTTTPGTLFRNLVVKLAASCGVDWYKMHRTYPRGEPPAGRGAVQDPARPIAKDDLLYKCLNPEP